MKRTILLTLALVILAGCGCFVPQDECNDEYYQPIGTAVLTANGFLIADYPEGLSDPVDIDAYKQSLQDEGYDELYAKILPLDIRITPVDSYFMVEVYEDGDLILYDISCTESRPDCWTYRGQCNPDTLGVVCGE
jgi:hypothetical protein